MQDYKVVNKNTEDIQEILGLDLALKIVIENIQYQENFDDIIKRANFEEIRSVLSALIEKIILDGEDIEIHWRF
jgi:hypothetical protein